MPLWCVVIHILRVLLAEAIFLNTVFQADSTQLQLAYSSIENESPTKKRLNKHTFVESLYR